MAGRRIVTPQSVTRAPFTKVEDPQVDRALDGLRGSILRLEEARSRAVVQVDLVVGTNKVRHGLGRPVAGYTLTPTVADATFAHAIDRTNPRPELEVWIAVIGADQPGATLEVF